MSTTTIFRFSSAFVLTGSLLLLSACANQLPAPPPVPGQPLTWAQQYELKKARYQADTDSRRQDRPCRLHGCS